MAVLKSKEASKLSAVDKKKKLEELKLALIKANVSANKSNAKTKEIKKAISRLFTFTSSKEVKKK
jgi:ribosomal protein L29